MCWRRELKVCSERDATGRFAQILGDLGGLFARVELLIFAFIRLQPAAFAQAVRRGLGKRWWTCAL